MPQALLATLRVLSIGRKILGRLAWFTGNVISSLRALSMGLALSLLVVFVLIPRRTAYLLLFVLAVTASLYVINPMLSTYSNHGMIHLGYVYATQRLQWPVEDPYLSGTRLYYPWTYHALVGGISSLLDVSPSAVFAACGLISLGVTVVVVAKISRLLDGDVITANFAVVIAVLAPTFLGGSAAMFFAPLVPAGIDPGLVEAFWYAQAIPPLGKFMNVTPMPPAMAVALLCLYELLRTLGPAPAKHAYLKIFVSITILGYIYPFIWLSACILVVCCTVVAGLGQQWRKVLGFSAALVLGNLAAAPYLLALTAGRATGNGIGLSRDPYRCLAHLLHIAVVLFPVWLLIALRGRSLIEQLGKRSWAHWAALGSALALLLTFIFLHVPTIDVGVGYKFRVMAVFCLAPFAASGLTRIYNWSKTACIIFLAFQLLPFCSDWYSRTPAGWGRVAEECYWQGDLLHNSSVEQDRLYQWIRERTPASAIVIDNKPYVPVYARRTLLVARQTGRNADDWWERRDGWLFRPDDWLVGVNGHSGDDVKRRNQLVDTLYSEDGGRSGGDIPAQLRKLTGTRSVFVIARDAREKDALNSRSFLRKVAEAHDWAIFALEEENAESHVDNRGSAG